MLKFSKIPELLMDSSKCTWNFAEFQQNLIGQKFEWFGRWLIESFNPARYGCIGALGAGVERLKDTEPGRELLPATLEDRALQTEVRRESELGEN